MTRAPQKRRLETRAKLLSVAEDLIDANGVSALRVEDVVARAGVAKGTFFSHFGDKDGLLAVILGAQVMRHIEDMNAAPAPNTPAEIAQRLSPLLDFISHRRGGRRGRHPRLPASDFDVHGVDLSDAGRWNIARRCQSGIFGRRDTGLFKPCAGHGVLHGAWRFATPG